MGALVGPGAVGRLERRVSWMPGAEGAPLDEDVGGVVVERLVVVVGWERLGTMR